MVYPEKTDHRERCDHPSAARFSSVTCPTTSRTGAWRHRPHGRRPPHHTNELRTNLVVEIRLATPAVNFTMRQENENWRAAPERTAALTPLIKVKFAPVLTRSVNPAALFVNILRYTRPRITERDKTLRQSARSFRAQHWHKRISVLTVMQQADNEIAFRYGRTFFRGFRHGLISHISKGGRSPSYLP